MSLHFPLPKIRTNGDEFALFVSPFTLPVNGHYCGAEIRNEFTLPLPKNLSLLVRNLSKWREPRDE